MPFINSKVNVKITNEQEMEIKSLLGEAIRTIPGKSEQWLMLGFEDECKLYFRGDNSNPIAFVDVSVYGCENKSAFDQLTGKICEIYNKVLGISPDHIYVKYQAVSNWGWNGGNL